MRKIIVAVLLMLNAVAALAQTENGSNIKIDYSKPKEYEIGGITVSGGECTLHHEFLTELFTEVRKLNKTCLIDSNGSFDFEKELSRDSPLFVTLRGR